MNEKLNVNESEGIVEVGYDYNEDGQNSIAVKADLGEAVDELLSKLKGGEITFSGKAKLDGSKVIFGIDMNGDGENLIELSLDILESFEESAAKIAK